MARFKQGDIVTKYGVPGEVVLIEEKRREVKYTIRTTEGDSIFGYEHSVFMATEREAALFRFQRDFNALLKSIRLSDIVPGACRVDRNLTLYEAWEVTGFTAKRDSKINLLFRGAIKQLVDIILPVCVRLPSDVKDAVQPPDHAVEAFLDEVRAELIRARAKFPGDRIMTVALAEEFGELCKAVLDEPAANVRKEAVQTCVMAARVVLDGDGSVTEWRAAKGLDPLVQPEKVTVDLAYGCSMAKVV